jgi:hypothetical protein
MSAVVALFLVVSAHAQSGLTGKWEGTTGAGARLALDLTVKDTTLTGTLTRNDRTFEIKEGKVQKNTFTFKAMMDDQAEGFTGELAGEDLKVWLDRRGPDSTVTLKRVKK